MGVPDLRFINRKISISEVAHALDLRFGSNGNIHCWRPELHQNGDRTASVGIRKFNNTVKCFGCDIGPLGPVDLVMAVLGMQNPGAAALWIAAQFKVPELPPGANLVQPERRIVQFGFETDIGLLVHSGLWAMLSRTARALVPVLLEFAERKAGAQTLTIQISFLALSRYGGVSSPNAIATALRQLQEIGWLSIHAGKRQPGCGPVRETSTYLLTPRSDALLEIAHATCAQMPQEIEIERKLRAEARDGRKRAVFVPSASRNAPAFHGHRRSSKWHSESAGCFGLCIFTGTSCQH
jgi:hypothetical protein